MNRSFVSHSTGNGSFCRRIFPGNHLHWYWQLKNKQEKIHKKHIMKPQNKRFLH